MQFMTRFLISVTTLVMGALLVGLSVLGIVHGNLTPVVTTLIGLAGIVVASWVIGAIGYSLVNSTRWVTRWNG